MKIPLNCSLSRDTDSKDSALGVIWYVQYSLVTSNNSIHNIELLFVDEM